MSKTNETKYAKTQLFADLKKDGIKIDAQTFNKAKSGDAKSIHDIGLEYRQQKQNYDRAMMWYRLAAVKNNDLAQNNIGFLYEHGLGVQRDYLVALEWFLRSASQNNKFAWENIALLFECGRGVPVNKYKALEWYRKSGRKPDKVKMLAKEGIRVLGKDKNKSIEQLIMETEDILLLTKKAKEDEQKKEISLLTKKAKEDEQKMENLLLEKKAKEDELKKQGNALKQLDKRAEIKLNRSNNRVKSLEEDLQVVQHELTNKLGESKKEIDVLKQSKAKVEEESYAKDVKMQYLEQTNVSLLNEITRADTASEQLTLKSQKERREIETLKQQKTKGEEESRAKDVKIKLLEEDIKKHELAAEQHQKEREDLLAAKNKKEEELKAEIDLLDQSKIKMEKETTAKIKSLEEQNRMYRLLIETKHKEPNQQESIEQYKREIQTMGSEMELLKTTNDFQKTQLVVKDGQIKTLEKVITSLCAVSGTPSQHKATSAGKFDESSQNLERLLEQERRLKDNEIKLIKQEMQDLLYKEKMKKRKLEVETQSIRNELKRLKTSTGQNKTTRSRDRDRDRDTTTIALDNIENQNHENDKEHNVNNNDIPDDIDEEEIKIETL